MLYKRQQKSKGLRRETLKIYRGILAFYKATIIPMVGWSFVRGGFRLDPRNLLAPLTVTPEEVLHRIASPEVGLEELVFPHAPEVPQATAPGIRGRAWIPGPTEFATSLQAYASAVIGTCPLCGETKVEDQSEEDQTN
jgi:hypothetical protein